MDSQGRLPGDTGSRLLKPPRERGGLRGKFRFEHMPSSNSMSYASVSPMASGSELTLSGRNVAMWCSTIAR